MGVSFEKGFSSLELIICSFILCLSFTALLPKLVHTDRLELEYEAIHMINDMRYIQAIADVKSVKDNFSGIKSLMKPYIVLSNNGYTIYYTADGKEKKNIKYTFPPNINILSYGKKIYYFSKDSVTNTITIELEKNGYIINIIIDRAGRIRLDKGNDKA